ncbi:hypothetical protein DUNSADRAFT_9998 [Dunaliella salina]|uniref:Encoded protein n=1 Tax=Dunaliella salina TaxID=3046 RepID=A0ABQ7GG80_DUNSA|nr:hypothetical protein DUNSADRAFT_9998 [Dunaliella salina]|eukprot:KAF5833619.1 hypothetical protein DUNSADRAFT_9998 [Dunaliella salina]
MQTSHLTPSGTRPHLSKSCLHDKESSHDAKRMQLVALVPLLPPLPRLQDPHTGISPHQNESSHHSYKPLNPFATLLTKARAVTMTRNPAMMRKGCRLSE